MTNISKQHSKF